MDNELFEKAPIPKAYFSLAMPVVLSMLVTLVYSMVRISFFPKLTEGEKQTNDCIG